MQEPGIAQLLQRIQFAPDIRDRLFHPFVTSKPGGLGIGLSICRSVIESHGGAINCESPAAGGTRFMFTLPGAAT